MTATQYTHTALELAAQHAIPHRGYFTLHAVGGIQLVPPVSLEGASPVMHDQTDLVCPIESCDTIAITMNVPGASPAAYGMVGLLMAPADPVTFSYTPRGGQ